MYLPALPVSRYPGLYNFIRMGHIFVPGSIAFSALRSRQNLTRWWVSKSLFLADHLLSFTLKAEFNSMVGIKILVFCLTVFSALHSRQNLAQWWVSKSLFHSARSPELVWNILSPTPRISTAPISLQQWVGVHLIFRCHWRVQKSNITTLRRRECGYERAYDCSCLFKFLGVKR